MEEEITDSSEKLISEFNEAKFQIIRLHNIWVHLRELREKGNLTKAKDVLDSAEIELCTDAKRLDESIKKEENKYSYKLNKLTNEIISSLAKNNQSETYKKIKEKEMLLRILQQDAGKGGKLREEEEDWF